MSLRNRQSWESEAAPDRVEVRAALTRARVQRLTLDELTDWTPRTRTEVRRVLLAAAVREGDAEAAAYLRTAPDAEGYPAPPWWYDADLGIDTERYPWDPPDLLETLRAETAARDKTGDR